MAWIHADGFTAVAQAAGRHLIHLCPKGRFLDLGCGDGALSRVMAAAGFEVHGIDASPAMVDLAKERVPTGRFRVGDVRIADFPTVDVVAAVGEVLGYALAHHFPLGRMLDRIHDTLTPGGLLLFDVPTMERAASPTRFARQGSGWRVVAGTEQQDGILVRTIDTWRDVAGEQRHRREVHRLLLFDSDAVLRALDAAGFDAQRLGGYDDYGFQEGWDGFEAWRR